MGAKVSPPNFPHTILLYEGILDNVHPSSGERRFAISRGSPWWTVAVCKQNRDRSKKRKRGPTGGELGAGVRWTAARGIVGWSSNSGYSGSVTNWRGTEGRKPCYLLIATTLRAVLHR